jgi:TolB protein
MRRITTAIISLSFAAIAVHGQETTTIKIVKSDRPTIAIPDFKGAAGAERYMDIFNATLWSEIENCGVLRMAPKSMYPLTVPQQPSDFHEPSTPAQSMGGRWLTDWLNPPTNANYLAIGYTTVVADQIVLSGWLETLSQPTVQTAQLIAKRYFGPVSPEGAKKVAAEFAADIMAQFGGKSLLGSKIYFISNRTGSKEVWQMNYDGTEQKPMTRYGNTVRMPAVSADGSKLAFTTWREGTPQIYIESMTTGRRLTFYNQRASLNMTPEFLPNGSKLLFSSTAGGGSAQIYIANSDGSGIQRVTSTQSIEVEARVNPKTGRDIAFTSGRTGHPQIFRMTLEGGDVQQLSSGEGEAVNPSWHPDGQMLAFAWTRGFDIGNFNIFVMDVATRNVVQLTHGAGRNENPTWAPDGYHIVFASKRGSKTQVYTMLADGTQVRQLTTEGDNDQPVWAHAIN